jgi:hypothetical protein
MAYSVGRMSKWGGLERLGIRAMKRDAPAMGGVMELILLNRGGRDLC